MPNLKDIKRRIDSVKNTQKITRAMKLVAAAKLRKAQEAVEASRPYSERMLEVMKGIALRASPEASPLLERRQAQNIVIVVYSGDKGLCGPFNSSVLKTAQKLIAENEGKGISLVLLGKKARDFFKRRKVKTLETILDVARHDQYDLAEKVADIAISAYTEGTADAVYLVFNKFRNVVVQVPQTASLLPVETRTADEEGEHGLADYEYEPSAEEILEEILRRYVISQLHQGLLESQASENGARMTAMDAATKNAKEMIDDLTLDYNKARQAAITTELIEVVSGADALEG
ncbi:MAG: ATP synthase F1 subunit gamma [Nitrospinota bacterium]|nr:ATP synthase F1 subunit gamma [Nitrospinota bacterium]